jgi:cbb3-type cytochrome oxidase subunit 3
MDINLLRSTVMLLSFVLFLGLMAWVWWPARREAMNDAGNLPFDGEVTDLQEPERRAVPSRAPSPRGIGRGISTDEGQA